MGARDLSVAAIALLAAVAGMGGADAAPSEGTIAFVRFTVNVGHPRIYVIQPNRERARRLRLQIRAADGPSWSRDGRLVFVGGINQANNPRVTLGDDLFLVRRDGTGLRRLTRGAAHEVGPVWAPDGKRIAYARSAAATPTRSSIYLLEVAGGKVRRLTSGNLDLQPSWSSDGRLIAFLRIDPKTRLSGIWVVRPDGTHLRRILVSIPGITNPVFSPVGPRLVVTDGQRLIVVRRGGTGRRTIAQLAADGNGDRIDPEPSWSPDGKAVVFTQMRPGSDGRADIWTVRADGTSLRRVTTSPGKDFSPTWGS